MTPNLNEATSLVNSIPLVKESIPVLMKLANGSNPNIPSYMALGRLQQIKAMVEHSQQPQMPQGTVKQNLERSVANMGMMNGRQQQMQQNMMQQGITAPGPAPEGVPQPAPMPQPEQMPQMPQEVMAAHGGILHAQTDPDMFNFAPGGIVAFAKEGEVKDKDKLKERQPDESFEQFRQRQIRAQADAQLQKDLALQDQTEQERLAELAKRKEAGQIPKSVYTTPQDVGSARKKTLSQEEMRAAAANTANSSGISTLLQGGREPIGIASASPAAPAPPPPPAPRPAAAPRPPAAAPAAPAASAAAPAAAATTGQGLGSLNSVDRVKQLLGQLTPSNKYIEGIDTAQAAAQPAAYDQQKAIADQLALNEALGIGTYGKNRREQMEKRAKEFEANRMSKLDQLISLGTAFSRPGARAGDVGQRSVELNEAERDAREKFQTAQDALMATVELADEAIRTGNASEILKTKAAKDKALQEWKAAGVEAKKIQAQAEGLRQQTGTQAATSVLGDEMRLQAERERTASAEKVAAANNVSAQKVAEIYAAATRAGANRPSEQERFANEYFAKVKAEGQAAADAWLAQQEKIRSVSGGVKYGGQDKEVEREIKVQAEIRAQTEGLAQRLAGTKDPAKRAAIQTQINDIEKKVRADVARAAGDAPPPNAVKLVKP